MITPTLKKFRAACEAGCVLWRENFCFPDGSSDLTRSHSNWWSINWARFPSLTWEIRGWEIPFQLDLFCAPGGAIIPNTPRWGAHGRVRTRLSLRQVFGGQGVLEKFAVLEDSGGKVPWDFISERVTYIKEGIQILNTQLSESLHSYTLKWPQPRGRCRASPTTGGSLLPLPRLHSLPQGLFWFYHHTWFYLSWTSQKGNYAYVLFFLGRGESASLVHVHVCHRPNRCVYR